jgi:tRNA (mo5U34)-methyltransferase
MRALRKRRSKDEAREFLARSHFIWHQKFQLVEEVWTPGVNEIEWILSKAALPGDLTGHSVLDVGTTNGGAAFMLEELGAERVVAVDIYPEEHFGFRQMKEFLSSSAEFVQANIYELPEVLQEEFDLILFWGVLYHLRHPLLAIDSLYKLCRGKDTVVSLETAVCDAWPGIVKDQPVVRFMRTDELSGDHSNWFSPSTRILQDWLESSGFEIVHFESWPPNAAERALLSLHPVEEAPEYQVLSYERPLTVRAEKLVTAGETPESS